MENRIKLGINAGDKSNSNKQDNAIEDAYRNKFIIPLDFEMLDSSAPYYQAGLGNRLCYEITFIDYNRVINPISTGGAGVFHPLPSKWLRTPQRNKLAPCYLVTFQT